MLKLDELKVLFSWLSRVLKKIKKEKQEPDLKQDVLVRAQGRWPCKAGARRWAWQGVTGEVTQATGQKLRRGGVEGSGERATVSTRATSRGDKGVSAHRMSRVERGGGALRGRGPMSGNGASSIQPTGVRRIPMASK